VAGNPGPSRSAVELGDMVRDGRGGI